MMRTIIILTFAAALASCTGSNKATTAKDGDHATDRKKIACGKLHVDMDKPHIDWFEENNNILSKSTEVLVLPRQYKVYAVDTAQVQRFFDALSNNGVVTTVVPLPQPADCQLFTVRNSKKDGGRVSAGTTTAEGEAMGQKLTITRNSMGKMLAKVNWFDIEYEMTTVFIEGNPYVVVYEKMPPPPPTDPVQEEPALEEIRYNK